MSIIVYKMPVNFLDQIPTDMTAADINLSNLKVFLNYIYELKKGIRKMALFTTNRRYRDFAVQRLDSQKIDYVLQEVSGSNNINIYFGASECMDVIRIMVDRPLHLLSPEEDFMLGAMLGYDISVQCRRFCDRKGRAAAGNL